MWFKLASATFTTHLGKMSELSNTVRVNLDASGFTVAGDALSFNKNDSNQSRTYTLTLKSNYEIENTVTVSVDSGNATATVSGGTGGVYTLVVTAATAPTSEVKVIVSGAVYVGTDLPDIPDPEEPDTPVNPTPGESTTLSPYSVVTGFYLDSSSKFAPESSSSVVVYSVQPNSTYTLSVEKKSTGTSSNANLIFAPAKSLNGLQANGTPDFAAGYTGRVVEMSANETSVLNYQFTTPADCIYLLFSNHKSGSTHTVVGIPGSGVVPEPERPEGTEIALTKAVDGVYLAAGAKYTADGTSQVLCYAVSPNKTYVIGAPSDLSKKLVICCVKSIDNVAAGNTADFATDWSDRQIGDAGANLTVTTPADCTHLVFSNYQKNQAPSYVILTN